MVLRKLAALLAIMYVLVLIGPGIARSQEDPTIPPGSIAYVAIPTDGRDCLVVYNEGNETSTEINCLPLCTQITLTGNTNETMIEISGPVPGWVDGLKIDPNPQICNRSTPQAPYIVPEAPYLGDDPSYDPTDFGGWWYGDYSWYGGWWWHWRHHHHHWFRNHHIKHNHHGHYKHHHPGQHHPGQLHKIHPGPKHPNVHKQPMNKQLQHLQKNQPKNLKQQHKQQPKQQIKQHKQQPKQQIKQHKQQPKQQIKQRQQPRQQIRQQPRQQPRQQMRSAPQHRSAPSHQGGGRRR